VPPGAVGDDQVGVLADGCFWCVEPSTAPPAACPSPRRRPGLDGIKAAAEVNRETPVPFILVPVDHDERAQARAAAQPVMAYLVKPVK
jgi:hypothetical protein